MYLIYRLEKRIIIDVWYKKCNNTQILNLTVISVIYWAVCLQVYLSNDGNRQVTVHTNAQVFVNINSQFIFITL